MAVSPSPKETVTSLLTSTNVDEAALTDRLWMLVYGELQAMARGHLARERHGHTLSTTDLVNEAYLKLVDQTQVSARGRTYFFGAAARAMRQILVDHARRRNRQKRGGKQIPVTLDEGHLVVEGFAADLLDLDEALSRLATRFPRQATVVECRYFGGLSVEETADVLDISPRTVKKDWALAKAWLYRNLHSTE